MEHVSRNFEIKPACELISSPLSTCCSNNPPEANQLGTYKAGVEKNGSFVSTHNLVWKLATF